MGSSESIVLLMGIIILYYFERFKYTTRRRELIYVTELHVDIPRESYCVVRLTHQLSWTLRRVYTAECFH